MRRLLVPFVLAAAACQGAPAADSPSEPAEFAAAEPTGKADSASATGGKGMVYRLQVEHGAYPAEGQNPNVLVYIPPKVDLTPPLDVVVFLHGHWNCIDNVIRATPIACSPRSAARTAHNLAAQMDATKKNAILVVPELMRDKADSSPGALADDDVFRALMNDTFQKTPGLTALTADDIGALQVITHSGGYKAAIGIANHGGVPVTDLVLLDSLYDNYDDYDAWINEWPYAFVLPRDRRFTIIYSLSAGTLTASQAMATRTRELFTDEDLAKMFVDDRTTATLPDAAYQKSLLFKRTGMGHDPLVRYYFGKLIATSDLAPLRAK